MREAIRLVAFVLWCGLIASCAIPAQDNGDAVDQLLEELVALEPSALDRWIQLDPQGYFDIQAAEVTYFDPFTERRINDRQALQMRLAPMKSLKLPFTDPRYEMIEPKVQRRGDVALLTFNLVNYGKLPGQPESVLTRWNATEVYCRTDGKWKIIHSHWSYVQAPPKPPGE
jgi:ketosteroid isomerase-like protein